MFTIIFKIENGQDVKVLAEAGATILDLMKDNNIHIDAPCSGNGTCGKCRVRVIAGGVEMERIHSLTDEDYDDQWRLACQSKVMPPSSSGATSRSTPSRPPLPRCFCSTSPTARGR